MPDELDDAPWKQRCLTQVEVELRERNAEEESKPIPSPKLRELRKEYSQVNRYAEIVKEGRTITLRENAFEAARLSIMRSRRAWQDKMEQAIRERTRESFDWGFCKKHRWSLSWKGRRLLLGEFVRVRAVGFKRIAWNNFAKVAQEVRIWSVRFR